MLPLGCLAHSASTHGTHAPAQQPRPWQCQTSARRGGAAPAARAGAGPGLRPPGMATSPSTFAAASARPPANALSPPALRSCGAPLVQETAARAPEHLELRVLRAARLQQRGARLRKRLRAELPAQQALAGRRWRRRRRRHRARLQHQVGAEPRFPHAGGEPALAAGPRGPPQAPRARQRGHRVPKRVARGRDPRWPLDGDWLAALAVRQAACSFLALRAPFCAPEGHHIALGRPHAARRGGAARRRGVVAQHRVRHRGLGRPDAQNTSSVLYVSAAARAHHSFQCQHPNAKEDQILRSGPSVWQMELEINPCRAPRHCGSSQQARPPMMPGPAIGYEAFK